MRRDPQEIIMLLSSSLKKSQNGEFLTIMGLKDRTGLHYGTVSRYAELIEYIQTSMPKITMEKMHSTSGIRILSKPNLEMSKTDELILYLFDKGAFRESTAIEMPKWITSNEVEKEIQDKLLEINDSGTYLLTDGIVKGAELADLREEVLIVPIGKQVIEERKSNLDVPIFDKKTSGLLNMKLFWTISELSNKPEGCPSYDLAIAKETVDRLPENKCVPNKVMGAA
jgi:hypothetical protein